MWKDATKKQQAAVALRYTATDVKMLGCVDEVIDEPEGGTHNDPALAMSLVDSALTRHLSTLQQMPLDAMLNARYDKFRNIAQFYTVAS
jgi:acetyl-CoA carboxylase carboxyl transferase subunit alpha